MLSKTVSKQTLYVFSGTVRQVFAGFILDRRSRGLKAGTVAYYQDELERFIAFLERAGIADLEAITPTHLRDYLLSLASHRNPGGVHAGYRAIRSMLNWYDDEFEPEGWRNPIRKVKAPRVNHQALPGVPVATIQRMIDACDTRLATRNQAIMLGLLDTGARAFEFIALVLADVDLVSGAVVIRQGKGDKRRTVYLGRRARRVLRKYLKTRPDLDAQSPLYATDEETAFTYNGLYSLIREASKRAGVERPGLHDFRRAFALEMLRNGADLASISRLLGHSSLAVTQRYLAQLDTDLQAAHEKGSPVDGWKL